MEGAKPNIGSCELPTGVLVAEGQIEKVIAFRELAGPEEDLLGAKMGATQKLSQIMSNVIISIGNISSREQIRALVTKLTITDRWFLLKKIRIHSLSSDYKFDVICQACGAKDTAIFDLSQIAVENPPLASNLFHEIMLPSGGKVRWKVATGETEEKIEKLANQSNAATVGLFARITEINDTPVKLSDVLQLSMRDRIALREDIDKKEGQFDDNFKHTCPKCGNLNEGELELEARSFFSL